MSRYETVPHSGGAPGHEESDARVRPIAIVGLVVAVMVAVVLVLSVVFFRYFSSHGPEAPPNPMAAGQPTAPPNPRLEAMPSMEYRKLRAEEDRRLSSYGWVDRKTGRTHIPIDRAMELQLQRGFGPGKEKK